MIRRERKVRIANAQKRRVFGKFDPHLMTGQCAFPTPTRPGLWGSGCVVANSEKILPNDYPNLEVPENEINS
jgi:hypothetical protein